MLDAANTQIVNHSCLKFKESVPVNDLQTEISDKMQVEDNENVNGEKRNLRI